MQSLDNFQKKPIKVLFTDIDDTLTTNGHLTKEAFAALWDLYTSNIQVVPVTGRPAGWCELIARQWPVAGVIGENGGFYFRHVHRQMKRKFFVDEEQRDKNRRQLEAIKTEVLSQVPGTAVASDQFCRLMDLAIDFCEDVDPLPKAEVQKIVDVFEQHGAQAKISSIHVNGWFGNYDKLTSCKQFALDELGMNLEKDNHLAAFIGDSPNDEPMFGFFENSFAVANIKRFTDTLASQPKYVSTLEGGMGFAEISAKFL